MKRSIFGILSIVLVSLARPFSANAASETTPFNLVNLARNGHFQTEGIPSHSALEMAIARNQVNAEDVIKAAIKDKRVSPEALNDASYVQGVQINLKHLMSAD